jgi:CRP/FNR family transcriptional regulator
MPGQDDVLAVLARSVFGVLAGADLRKLSAIVVPTRLPVGRLVYDPQLGIVLAGLVRAFVADASSHQLTICYLRPGDSLGLARLAGRHFPTAFQALADTWMFNVGDDRFAEFRAAHPPLGWAAANELGVRLDEVEAELTRVAFASLRQRLAYHLLALTHEHSADPVHQAQLAAAVGSVREVIGRTLAQMRHDGLVDVGPTGVVVTDAERLRREAEAG